MKILLASLSIEDGSRFPHDPNSAYPIGLAYLYSVLEKNGYEVRLRFLNNFSYEIAEKNIIEYLANWKPEVIGFQIMSMNRVSSFKLIERINKEYAHIKIIIGGVHSSIMFEQILKKYPDIIAVIGESEITIIELLNALQKKKSLEYIQGIAFNRDGEIIITSSRELISDLDSLPNPKHEVFFDDELDRKKAHIISSRGCPFNCSFCCLKFLSQRKLRYRNIDKVIEEIVLLKKKYPRLAYIQFHDDTFLMDNNRIIEFCKKLVKENIDIAFECSARVKPISKEMFRWLEKAGCQKIMFGLETGSEKLLKSIHKGINQKDVLDLFNVLKNFNFTITTFLMCGFPGENDETISETIKFVQRIQKIKYNWIAGVGKLWVYPGTEIYENMKNAACIEDGFWLSDNDVPYYTVEHSFNKLLEFENRIMNNVSLERIFTFKGFINHFLKMPIRIIWFLKKNPVHLPRLIDNGSMFFKIMGKIYFFIKNKL